MKLLFLFFIVFLAHAEKASVQENKALEGDKKLVSEFLMVRQHVEQRPVKAKIYLFNRDINKDQFIKNKIEVEHYDSF